MRYLLTSSLLFCLLLISCSNNSTSKTESEKPKTEASQADSIVLKNVKQHVNIICNTSKPRNHQNIEILDSVAKYIQDQFGAYADTVYYQEFKVVEYNDWDSAIEAQAMVSGMGACGENRYLAIENILQFYLAPDCLIKIEPRNIVLAKVRLEWSLDEFYSSGGTTMFLPLCLFYLHFCW